MKMIRRAYVSFKHNIIEAIVIAGACNVILALSLFYAGLYYVFVYHDDMPDIQPFIQFEPPIIGQIYDADGQTIIELAREYRRIISYQDLRDAPLMEQAILSAEDKNFFSHDGYDFSAILRAALHNFWHVGDVQGASTLTQQIVKLYFLHNLTEREDDARLVSDSFVMRRAGQLLGVRKTNKLYRKLYEVRISIWVEKYMARYYGSKRRAKEEILARWASYVYVYNGRYGMRAGAEYYFRKTLPQLTPDEAALLAGITKNPPAYAPRTLQAKNSKPRWRRNIILDQMAANGYLTKLQAQIYKIRQIRVSMTGQKTAAPAVVNHVFDELNDTHGLCTVDDLFAGNMYVHTAANADLQATANAALEYGIAQYEKRHPQAAGFLQGAVVILKNNDGAILAEVGGRSNYRDRTAQYSDLNRAIQSKRQPGSAFKPFVYLTAFGTGWILDSMVFDGDIFVPMGWHKPSKKIENYDHKSKQFIPVRQALAESRNQATMRIVQQMDPHWQGIQRVIKTAYACGIKSQIEPYPTSALGASEVTLLELTNAYRAIASGISTQPYLITYVENRFGQTVFRTPALAKPVDGEVVSADQLSLIREGLRGVVRIPGGTANSLNTPLFPIPIAGKTGTTSNFKDAGFCGFTYGENGITVCVRVGFDNPDMGFDEDGIWNGTDTATGTVNGCPTCGLGEKETGGRIALPIFREIMLGAYAGQHPILGTAPEFPEELEQNIDRYLQKDIEVTK